MNHYEYVNDWTKRLLIKVRQKPAYANTDQHIIESSAMILVLTGILNGLEDRHEEAYKMAKKELENIIFCQDSGDI